MMQVINFIKMFHETLIELISIHVPRIKKSLSATAGNRWSLIQTKTINPTYNLLLILHLQPDEL